MTLWTVPGTGYAQQIVNAGDGPTMVINRDEFTQLYVGNDNSVASKNGTGDIDIIDPLSYIVYDGIDSKFAICAVPNLSVQVDCVKGATNWAPSPAQAAFQISQLGLATATNQVTQNTTAQATNTVLNSGIALPIGAAQDATVGTGNNTLAGINANHAGLMSVIGNPYFTAPNGNADITGWIPSGNNIASAGRNGAVSLPAGSGFVNGVQLAPTGTNNFSSVQPQGLHPITPNQIPYCSYLLNLNGSSQTVPAVQAVVTFQYYDATNTFIANHKITVTIPKANVWLKIYAEDDAGAPANTAGVLIIPEYDSVLGGNISPAQVGYITAVIAGTLGIGGTMAGDHGRHLAIGGTPLLHGFSVITEGNTGTIAASGTKFLPNLPFNKPGYLVGLQANYVSASGANPFFTTQVRWLDNPVTGDIGNDMAWKSTVLASGQNVPTLLGKGPVLSPLMQVEFINLDPAQAISVTYRIWESTHHIARDDWRDDSAFYQPPPSFVSASAIPAANILALAGITIPAAPSQKQFILPLYAGLIQLFLGVPTGTAPSAGQVLITVSDAITGATLFAVNHLSNPGDAYQVPLGRAPALLTILNSGALSSFTLNISAVPIEYAS